MFPIVLLKSLKEFHRLQSIGGLKNTELKLEEELQLLLNPGLYLKKQIPIKTKSWDEGRVGYCELDTVAHCGESAKGEFVYTVDLSDLPLQWTELEAVLGKGDKGVVKALDNAGNRLPSGLRGIDPDNGGEFINWHLFRYTKERHIEFTRGRPYQKNDNAHVEQKNWTHVRKIMGYRRYNTQEQVDLMNDIYRNELRLYKNFFIPNIKLISKKRVGKNGEKIKRIYNRPRTPYERAMRSKQISKEKKLELKQIYENLNPAKLRRDLFKKVDKLKRTR